MQISLICSFILILAAVQAKHHKTDQNWKDHASKHGLQFTDDNHEASAYVNYQETDKRINQHNNNSNVTYKLGHNEFSHWVNYYNYICSNDF